MLMKPRNLNTTDGKFEFDLTLVRAWASKNKKLEDTVGRVHFHYFRYFVWEGPPFNASTTSQSECHSNGVWMA